MSRAGFERRRLQKTETRNRRCPRSRIPVEMLPLRFYRSALKRFCCVKLRSGRGPVTRGETHCQRTDDRDNQHARPTARAYRTIFQPRHIAANLLIIQHEQGSFTD